VALFVVIMNTLSVRNFKHGQEGRESVREEGEGQRGRNGGGAEHLL